MMVVLPKAPLPCRRRRSSSRRRPCPNLRSLPIDFFHRTIRKAPSHWAVPARHLERARLRTEGAETIEVARTAIAEMPASLRQVIVLRDVEGRSADNPWMA